jgi:cell division transport system ATP-binding protein
MEMLTRFNNSGATVLIATHDHTIYRDLDHRLLELRGGQLHQLRDGVMQ